MQKSSDNSIIYKLNHSLSALESAISKAREVLYSKESVPEDLITRLDSYDEALYKQRILANNLSDLLIEEKWAEVGRIIDLINNLSAMIRDDAKEILNTMSNSGENFGSNFNIPPC
ncbi:MAG TPA: hypothetical protein PKD37_04630 [Oligoflexia bacterium]|nr:hypothetical protein [Oligoflexia bacterium]HMP27250.1 hypothetical protein [Oligoflexia bacterium]